MQEEQKPDAEEELEVDKPTEPRHEEMPVFSIGNVTVVVTE